MKLLPVASLSTVYNLFHVSSYTAALIYANLNIWYNTLRLGKLLNALW